MPKASGTIAGAASALRRGELVGIFPEGGRSHQPLMGRSKGGVVRIAARAGVPIIPVSVAGAFRVWPYCRLLPRPGRMQLTFHKPLALRGARVDRNTEEVLLDKVRGVINEGLVETYIEWHTRRIYDPLPCEVRWRSSRVSAERKEEAGWNGPANRSKI